MNKPFLLEISFLLVLIFLIPFSFFVVTSLSPDSQTQITTITSEISIEIVMEWNQTYGGPEYDSARSIIQTLDGGFALAGDTSSYGAGENDMWLVKTDVDGNIEWNQTYGGKEDESAHALIQDADGGFVLAGETDSYGAGERDMWLLKTDSNGDMEWNQTYGGIEDEIAFDILQTSDGGFALTGDTSSYGVGGYDMWLVKTDADGIIEWNQTYGGNEDERAYTLTETIDGGYALAGVTSSYSTDIDMWLVKTDIYGNMMWDQTFGGTGHQRAEDLIQTLDGGFALAGQVIDIDQSVDIGDDILFVKTDMEGNLVWNQTYGGTEPDAASSVMQHSDGGFSLAGFTVSYGTGYSDMWLIKTDNDGNVEGEMIYGGSGSDEAYALIQTLDEGFGLAGRTSSFGAGDRDMWLIKLAPFVETILNDGTNSNNSIQDPNTEFLDIDVLAGSITMLILIYSYRIGKRKYQ